MSSTRLSSAILLASGWLGRKTSADNIQTMQRCFSSSPHNETNSASRDAARSEKEAIGSSVASYVPCENRKSSVDNSFPRIERFRRYLTEEGSWWLQVDPKATNTPPLGEYGTSSGTTHDAIFRS